MNAIRIAAAAALLMVGGAASAQSATDAGCIILSNVFAQKSTDQEAQKTAEAALYFYLGRIGDHITAPQLKALLDQQAKIITDKTAPTMMTACMKGVQAKLDLMDSLSPKTAQPAPPPKKP